MVILLIAPLIRLVTLTCGGADHATAIVPTALAVCITVTVFWTLGIGTFWIGVIWQHISDSPKIQARILYLEVILRFCAQTGTGQISWETDSRKEHNRQFLAIYSHFTAFHKATLTVFKNQTTFLVRLRHCESKVPCLRTQWPNMGCNSNSDSSITESQRTKHHGKTSTLYGNCTFLDRFVIVVWFSFNFF